MDCNKDVIHGTIKDGSSEHIGHVWSKIGLSEEKIGFQDFFDVTECLQQIDNSLLHLCAPCSELPWVYTNYFMDIQ